MTAVALAVRLPRFSDPSDTVAADYSDDERRRMGALARRVETPAQARELLLIHELKAELDAILVAG